LGKIILSLEYNGLFGFIIIVIIIGVIIVLLYSHSSHVYWDIKSFITIALIVIIILCIPFLIGLSSSEYTVIFVLKNYIEQDRSHQLVIERLDRLPELVVW